MERGLISIIIPTYNCQNYITRCLDSIKRQTYKNFEAIIVNDGSKDETQNICEKYVLEDARFILLNKENGGSSSARNYGLERVRGEFLTWIDSDDEVSDDYLEKLFFYLKKYDADISVCGYQYLMDTLIKKQNGEKDNVQVYKTKKDLTKFMKGIYNLTSILYVVPWGKLFKSYLFDNVRFPEGKCFDDQATIYKAYLPAKKIVEFDDMNYYYYYIPTSISHTIYNDHPDDMFPVYEERIKLFKHCGYKSLITDTKYFYILNLIEFLKNKDLDKNTLKAYIKRLKELAAYCMFKNISVKRKVKCFLLVVYPKIFIKNNK